MDKQLHLVDINLNEDEGFLRLMKSYINTSPDKQKAIDYLKNFLDRLNDN